jgi:DnaK suppressor protein
MRSVEIHEIELALRNQRESLIKVIEANEQQILDILQPDESGDSQVDYNHPADMISGDADYEKNIRLVERERAELVQIDEALRRIAQGVYGKCERCEDDINVERLRAIPFAKLCMDCQSDLEEKTNRSATLNMPRTAGISPDDFDAARS